MRTSAQECESAARWATNQFRLRSWTTGLETDDLLQEARIGAWRAWQKAPRFTAACYGAKHALLDYGRQQGRYSRAGVDRQINAAVTVDELEWLLVGRDDGESEILDSIMRLADRRDRRIVLCRYLGFTHQQIATDLGVTQARISHLCRGRIASQLGLAA